MRLVNKKSLIILTSILLVIISIVALKQNKPVELDEVKLLEASNNTSFAMYKEDGEVYTEVEGNTFPEGYVLNINKSKCIDNSGNELKDVLSYEDSQVKLTSNRTSYCYLYFDESLGLEIKNKNPNRLSTEVKGDMYRFQGQQADNVENYICFGTSDKQTCLEHPNQYMYRIIGIESKTGRVKVIKKEALDKKIAWADSYDDNIEFTDSNICKAINGNDFLDNPTYIPDGWKEKISDNTWIYGDMLVNDTLGSKQIGEELYKVETGLKKTHWHNYATKDTPGALSATVEYSDSEYYKETVYYTEKNENWTKTFPSKISLMYLHDYYLSVSDEAICQYNAQNYGICKTGWMHLSQNDADISSFGEWTMSRVGWYTYPGWFSGYIIVVDYGGIGSAGDRFINEDGHIRPVFYIDASQTLKDGTGKLDDPFVIN